MLLRGILRKLESRAMITLSKFFPIAKSFEKVSPGRNTPNEHNEVFTILVWGFILVSIQQ